MNLSAALCNFEGAKYLLFSDNITPLVYYSHLPITIISLILGFFILFKGRKNLPNQILFFITFFFSAWVFLDSIFWASNRSDVIMFVWSLQILFEPLVHAGCLYLIYVLANKKDAPFMTKLIAGALYLPLIIFVPTAYSLSGFDLSSCLSVEGPIALYYTYLIEIIFSLWLVIYSFRKYRIFKVKDARKEILNLTLGAVLLLFSFSLGNIISSFSEDWRYAQIGLFTMPIFIGFLVYSIVKFKTFNIKLVAAQALVIAIIILIGSQFFFIQNSINRTLTAISLGLIIIFGWWLVRSVKVEIKRKEELAIANAELQKLDQAKNDFINIASHQLKTPISVIKGVISLVQDGTMDSFNEAKKKEFFEGARIKCQKLEIIVKDILNATSLINSKYSVMDKDVEAIALRELFAKIIKDFESEIKEREIEVRLLPSKEILPIIYGQRKYLEEAFSNLLTNAIKYTPSPKKTSDIRDTRIGKAFININLKRGGDKNVIISVADNGIGISKEDLPKLFKKFSRGQNAVNMYTDGTGLGLFVIKEIVEGHGGKVWVESELNKGSTFFVDLPIREQGGVNIKEYIIKKSADTNNNSQ
ncbi:MAG: HAMP domain-containing sensor histidine kinase [Candidatus Komeilibacteria bacterium]|nr:HAMP domain-containing sensor histidine kinase [Candidatus Komeilibacteria bacterium]